jgi:PPK2 family polyphosphate:nucleotide phosphotransferase
VKQYKIGPGTKVRLSRFDPDDVSGLDRPKSDNRRELDVRTRRLGELQELLYAEHRHSVLVVLQGMDSAGKDGTIRRVFEGVNPQGVRVASFKQPTASELDHDFLWRVHAQVPARGELVLFNRSHYEDVLITRVHGLISRAEGERRFHAINEFERALTDEGTTILKFFLHISRGEQKQRLTERLRDPTKYWKFREADLQERSRWAKYRRAYEAVLSHTSTRWAPWYVVPANRKWFRDVVVSSVLVRTLEEFRMRYPPLPRALRGSRVR